MRTDDVSARPTGPRADAPTGELALVLGALGEEPATIDEVIERSGLASGRAAAFLLELELSGRVRQIDGKRFVRAPQPVAG